MACEICGGKCAWTSLIGKNNIPFQKAFVKMLNKFFINFRREYLLTMLNIDGYDIRDEYIKPKTLDNMNMYLNTVCEIAKNEIVKTGKDIIKENKDLKKENKDLKLNIAAQKEQISHLTNKNEELKRQISNMVKGPHFTKVLKENFKLSKRDEVLKEIESDIPEDIKKINKRVDGIRRNWKNVDWKAIEKADAEIEKKSAKPNNNKRSKINNNNNYIYIEENL